MVLTLLRIFAYTVFALRQQPKENQVSEVSSKIEVGQKIIYKGDMANCPGNGAVVAVKSTGIKQGSMFSLGSGRMVPIDSSVAYDIALEDGRMMRQVFISNIGGEFSNKSCRFMLDDGQVSAEEVAGLLAAVAMKVASDKAAKDAKDAAFAAAKAVAEEAGKKLGLIPEAEFNKSGKRGSAAAYNLRAELKAAGLKAAVKQDGYTSINVTIAAGTDAAAVKAIGDKYEAGSFDGMTDCYNYAPGAWGSVFGDVQYVFYRGD